MLNKLFYKQESKFEKAIMMACTHIHTKKKTTAKDCRSHMATPSFPIPDRFLMYMHNIFMF